MNFMSHFQPLSLDHRKLVGEYLRRYPPVISEMTFTNLFVWRHVRPIWLYEALDSLMFLIDGGPENNHRKIMLGPPIGPAGIIEALNHLPSKIGGAVRISQEAAERLRNTGMEVFEDRDNFDYVYSVAALASLKGRQFSKKRNHINQCLEKYDCQYESIDRNNIEACMAVQDRWCRLRECSDNPGLCGEYRAILESFDHFEDFELLGGAVRVNGRIEAFALGEQLRPGVAVWHFEKAMPEFQGLGQLINKWFSENELASFELVNREQDLGIKGLRQAKESYYPDHLVPKFNTTPHPPHAAIAGCV